ncbi:MAG TPA: hypothetical protein VLA42_12610 [Verrucomicrobiae bacterium]|nr:hypothetical protein [Verrucomicrobiae bacterium]
MIRYWYAVTLGFVAVTIPLRAANRPHVGTDSQNGMVWTNDDLERLHSLGLISIVGQIDQEESKPVTARAEYVKTQDPEWYAEESARLRDELERRRAELDRFRRAIDDARSLETATSGIDLNGGDVGSTPQAGIENLQQRVSETETQLDALEELARRNDMPPGLLRGQ